MKEIEGLEIWLTRERAAEHFTFSKGTIDSVLKEHPELKRKKGRRTVIKGKLMEKMLDEGKL